VVAESLDGALSFVGAFLVGRDTLNDNVLLLEELEEGG
jgi:hypothetical protein